ncbi:MAG: hypothetical protein K6U87_04120 [Firmicutes bacterium]|nr:hypothetical protein [Bacillota bacterium]
MEGNPKVEKVETEGVQIKVWLPADVYDLLKARAARKGTSVAAEARRLLLAGLANIRPSEGVEQALAGLGRFIEQHLEPLVFVAAMDAAFGREAWQYQFYAAYGEKAEAMVRELGERATKRLQRKLRGIDTSEGERPGRESREDQETENG